MTFLLNAGVRNRFSQSFNRLVISCSHSYDLIAISSPDRKAKTIKMLPIDCAMEEITPWDQEIFNHLISIDLTPTQVDRIIHPSRRFEDESSVLAIHWHPEMVPLDLAQSRIQTMYPQMKEFLIIPTQHNELLTYGQYAGAEVDCRATAFNRKIQILLHFKKDRIEKAHSLRSMIAHTSQYRSSQLFEFMASLADPIFEDRLQEAAKQTGVEEEIVRFAVIQTRKLRRMIHDYPATIPELSLKNKLLMNYVNAQRVLYDNHAVDRTTIFLAGVKEIVKRHFRLNFFYDVQEVIEEARTFGGGVIVPHPEQFWPVLLADYDVDGYEVWNPQSREFTEFLIQVVVKKNMSGNGMKRPLLIVMGDDTHLGEKVLDPGTQNPEKAAREIGYQPAWRDQIICDRLKSFNFDKIKAIKAYKNRLN